MCKEAKVALREGGITLSQAEAFTLGGHEAQRNLLDHIERGFGDFSPEAIKAVFLGDRPTVAFAIFPLGQYTAAMTTDLFAEGETSYFDNTE